MTDIIRIHADSARRFERLTFPHLQCWLREWDDEDTLAVGCSRFSEPVGLALASLYPEARFARVRSVFAHADFRGKGLGTALLSRLEAELVREGYDHFSTEYGIGKPSTKAFERMLATLGWEAPSPHSLYCQVVGADVPRLMNAPWMTQRRLPPEFSLFPWGELTGAEKERMQARHAAEPIWEVGLDPFSEGGPPYESFNSLGLRYQGDVVGWIITERAAPGIIRYDRLFVQKKFRKTARGVALLAESIRRQWEHEGHLPGRGGVWRTNAGNAPMACFIKRRLGPYLTSMTETYQAVKNLRSEI
jgi:GNAT superfamily N-acetyltransferase